MKSGRELARLILSDFSYFDSALLYSKGLERTGRDSSRLHFGSARLAQLQCGSVGELTVNVQVLETDHA